jgi:hypothetical protein
MVARKRPAIDDRLLEMAIERGYLVYPEKQSWHSLTYRWRGHCTANLRPCASASMPCAAADIERPAEKFPPSASSLVVVEYGHLGVIHPSQFRDVADVMRGVAGCERREVVFACGRFVYCNGHGEWRDHPQISLTCPTAVVQEVVSLLNDLILDRAK